ncbi:ABC transporter substrate-binding protein, partial [Phytoactinopolyspora endophytica]|uniref:ABC transporter substrate-binding protein n=1 Tax=Phytoactinopolyspora endophytica TaxID=1642495 RepID=UPI00197C6E64
MIDGRNLGSRRASALLAYPIVLTLLVAGCADAGETSAASATGDAAEAAAVDACPDPVEGFAVTVDGNGEPLEPTDGGLLGDPGGDLPDPHALSGPSTAEIADENIYPVVDDPEPALPVVVESCDGETVEINDTSRILAVDLYGTLAEIVFSVGMGDNVIGRDTSTGFPQAEDLPLVTPSAHDLNAEAILELDPTVVLTDTSIGPPEVQQQLRDAGVPVV